ncbi:MAG: PTS sugar transporter subunit IIA [Proteobacteria bacterium]|nr:PTS sugar transporter subunit IIA [Pseudomonadota bacterium]
MPLAAKTRGRVVSAMVELAAETGWLWDTDKMAEAVLAREQMQPTALDIGVALLHQARRHHDGCLMLLPHRQSRRFPLLDDSLRRYVGDGKAGGVVLGQLRLHCLGVPHQQHLNVPFRGRKNGPSDYLLGRMVATHGIKCNAGRQESL